MEEAVFYKASDSTIYVKASGHVTALVCPQLKAAIFARLETEPRVDAVYFDLSGCEYMDSTFLGLIVGAQKRFAQGQANRTIVLLAVNEACKGLLRTIGVLGMVRLSDEAIAFPPDLERLSSGMRADARLLLDAHEELSELSPENRKRFSALTTVLKSAVEAEERKKE